MIPGIPPGFPGILDSNDFSLAETAWRDGRLAVLAVVRGRRLQRDRAL